MTDISTRKDIYNIIKLFYDKMIADETMVVFFEEFINNKTLEEHFISITDFWEDILFNTNNYSKNVMQKHLIASQKNKFEKHHFINWLHYLTSTIDGNFKGLQAELMKNRAQSIATVMQVKMNVYNQK